ncbi:MAG: site-2 protease family protein, partial [Chloroflexota bacterium]
MSSSFRLGRLFGIPIHIHYSWFIIFLLVTFTFSGQYFPSFYPHWPTWLHWATGVATSVLFFASVLAHELTHSLVSAAYGIPVRSITLFIFGGVASISREARRPLPELAMAGSGPLSSLAIAGFFWLLWWFTATGVSEPVAALSRLLATINLSLALFNLIPGFPLDGGRVFRSLAWQVTGNYRLATNIAFGVGQVIAYL